MRMSLLEVLVGGRRKKNATMIAKTKEKRRKKQEKNEKEREERKTIWIIN